MSEPAGPDAIRIGTQEREDAIRVLGHHFAAGRIPLGEYEQRIDAAINGVTRGDLRGLFGDLPAPYPPFLAPPVWSAPVPQPLPLYPQYRAPVDGHYSDKSKIVAGVLQIISPFGLGRFYLGDHGIAVAQLLTCGGFYLWTFIDGILLIVNGGTDGQGRPLRD